MRKRFAVIMAGGRGERFWPQSRVARPKHLLPIVGDKPLLAQTIERLHGIVPPERVLVLTNRQQEEAVRAIAAELPPENIVAEPVGRDTAAAVALATVLVGVRSPDAAFAMLPADHVIHDVGRYRHDLQAAFLAAEREDALVTLGIRPTEPATGFGYIHRGEPRAAAGGAEVYAVQRFVEKPSHSVAFGYVQSGEYFWNAGMFVWRVPVVATAFAAHAPEVWTPLQAVAAGLQAGAPLGQLLEAHYPGLRRVSVDYAVMEKSTNVLVVPATFDWDDVGSWTAVPRHLPADPAGNVTRGRAVVEQGAGNLVVSTDDHLVAVLGAEDLVVVHTPDATLVCPKARAQEIKALLQRVADRADLRSVL